MSDVSILVPIYSQPNLLSLCLRGLVRNSVTNPRIIVLWSDAARFGEPTVRDWLFRPKTFEKYRKYGSVQEYIEKRRDFTQANNIEFADVTEQCYQFMLDCKAGKIGGVDHWEGGVDIALKDNLGLGMTKTEFITPNWDSDFYPTPGWDAFMVDVMRKAGPRSICVPIQMQPLEYEVLPEYDDAWEDFRHIACARLTMPVPIRGVALTTGGTTISDEEQEAFWNRWKIDGVFREKPGVRDRLHHFPVMYRTEELRNTLVGHSYIGSGYDVAIDNLCGELGFMKYSHLSAWISHKAYINCDEGEL